MSIKTKCPRCHSMLALPEKGVGKTLNCPKCDATFAVYRPGEEPEDEPRSAPPRRRHEDDDVHVRRIGQPDPEVDHGAQERRHGRDDRPCVELDLRNLRQGAHCHGSQWQGHDDDLSLGQRSGP